MTADGSAVIDGGTMLEGKWVFLGRCYFKLEPNFLF